MAEIRRSGNLRTFALGLVVAGLIAFPGTSLTLRPGHGPIGGLPAPNQGGASSVLSSGQSIGLAASPGPASVQEYDLLVTDGHGSPLPNVSIQGFVLAPASLGHGFEQVLAGETDAGGHASFTHLTALKGLAQAWVNELGNTYLYSHPNVLFFMSYVTPLGQYFNQTSAPIVETNGVAASVVQTRGIIDLSKRPSVSGPLQFPTTPFSREKISPDLPPPPGGCIDKLCDYSIEWVPISGTDVVYPQSGYGSVGTVWLTIPSGSAAYGTISESFAASSSTSFNVGVAIGKQLNSGGQATFQPGGLAWTTTTSAGATYSSTLTSPGSTYIYVEGQVEGEEFEEYLCNINYCTDQGVQQYDTGLLNPELNGNVIVGGPATGLPPWLSGAAQSHYPSTLYETVNGQSSPLSGLKYNVQSVQLVDTYMQSDTQWINVGIDVGAILVWALGPEVAIPADMALSISAGYTSSTISNTEASIEFDAPAGKTVSLDLSLGTASYSLSNGLSGNVPLMGMTLTTASPLSVSITQSATSLIWHISGLTPNGGFKVHESTSQGFIDDFSYTASSTGTDSRSFNYGSGYAGDKVTLTVTDSSSGRQASTTYTVIPYIYVTQTSGQYPVWHISLLTPNGAFTVYETASGSSWTDTFTYTASSTGTDSRSFSVGSLPVGTVVTLTVTDSTSGTKASTSFTLQAY